MRAHENPFRVERLHAMSYRPQGDGWPAVMRRLDGLRCRGAIVGPHGSGKTTLMLELAERLAERGRHVVQLWMNQESPPPDRRELRRLAALGPNDVVLFDGGCHLSAFSWWRLRLATWRAGGLIITAHRPGRLPTLVATRTTPGLLGELIDALLPREGLSHLLPSADELHRRHRGDVRAALRELYDRCAALPDAGSLAAA